MPLANYPVGLPYKPTLNGFIRQLHHKPVSSFEPEDGPPIVRVQSNTRIKRFSYRLIFTDAQYATWETFAEVTLVQSTQHFMMSVPLVARTYVTRRVYIEGSNWTDEPVGKDWAVLFALNIFVSASA